MPVYARPLEQCEAGDCCPCFHCNDGRVLDPDVSCAITNCGASCGNNVLEQLRCFLKREAERREALLFIRSQRDAYKQAQRQHWQRHLRTRYRDIGCRVAKRPLLCEQVIVPPFGSRSCGAVQDFTCCGPTEETISDRVHTLLGATDDDALPKHETLDNPLTMASVCQYCCTKTEIPVYCHLDPVRLAKRTPRMKGCFVHDKRQRRSLRYSVPHSGKKVTVITQDCPIHAFKGTRSNWDGWSLTGSIAGGTIVEAREIVEGIIGDAEVD
ncbi:uncharacterized protein LOC129590201 [Paramacrobiotus metropolitanus]|uniref:uncharacterized protein LOC129590201 n=1 Tax=Paramacrobiotus metropolitanus TaxID=2943436 RepID=UPI0024458201|nr:uncharacterized protein LOC129590201 [Paramacrobiotus metropolitanus]